jgi:hypothetical protein
MSTLREKLGINETVLALSVARFGDALGNSILFVIIPLFVAGLASTVPVSLHSWQKTPAVNPAVRPWGCT